MTCAFPVRLYLLRTSDMEDPREHPEWEPELPEGRWTKAARMISLEDRKNSAGAGWLLRYVFYKEGILFSPDAVKYGVHGKPYHEILHFSLSHSGEWVFCAVGSEDIGCDIQKRKPCRASMVRRFFTVEEQSYIFSAEGRARDERFITIWCRKESVLKRTGEGLSRDLRTISCLTGEGFYEMHFGDYVLCVSPQNAADAAKNKVHVEYVSFDAFDRFRQS